MHAWVSVTCCFKKRQTNSHLLQRFANCLLPALVDTAQQ
jgi:hypothetical protein